MRLIDPLLRRPAALAAALFCIAAHAAPEQSADAPRLLQDKTLVAASDAATSSAPPADTKPGFVRQMRDSASGMVVSAMNFLGVRYRRGGTTAEDGFDCSGFTRHVFETSLGLILPRRADEQAAAPGLLKVKRDDLQPGDLVFFNTLKRTFSHVGIYVGEGKFIHAPRSGSRVRVEDMRFAYWAKRFTGARRPETPPEPATAAAANPQMQTTAAPSALSLVPPAASAGPSPWGRGSAALSEP